MKTTTAAVSAASLFALFAAPALAGGSTTIWEESVDGDFSDDGFNTTDLGTLGLGGSIITGDMGSGIRFDPDYFTFTIAAGQFLESITMTEYVPGSGIEQSFIALQEGPQVTSEFDASVFLGSSLIGTADVGQDVLDNIGLDLFGGNGFTGPLGAGTYSIWWQETATIVNYAFEFNVVPAPAGVAMLGMGGLLAARRRR